MPVKDEGTYVDTGTGAVQGPTEPEVHGDPDNDGTVKVDLKQNKGMVPLAGKVHTYENETHEDKPTPSGAYDWAPPDTHHQWPAHELRDKATKKPHKK